MALNMHKKDLQFQKPYQIVKSKKYKKFCASKLLIWRKKWTAGVRHCTSLVVRRVSSGRPIVVLFWTNYAFPRQIKPGILKLTTSKGHSNLLTVFSFVNCEEKGYCRVVSVGQLSFDCRSYCGRSCRMQGSNRPRSIYQYSNIATRLSGQTSMFGVVFFVSKSHLGIEGQKKLQKFAILPRRPRSRAWILIYRTWPIGPRIIQFRE